ncbi:hypothetical protein BSZ35_12385 [Salinibacter sp. 10B]|uniref:cation:proton antiporter n=1 Tax=Salinibacter sp. 10B TaxID=1923971 RepID=UPI000CF54E17|nr:cation:proton antiporter [Salinibacter sp. 10B]PQJ35292.1 hypothetical protein BSZ35_12385 [Salinibacter sp. 10B]
METSALYALLVGSVLVLAILSEAGLERLGFPDLLGYLALGVLLRELDHFWNVVPPSSTHVLTFLSEFGIIVLLFQVGLQCNPQNLFSRLPGATLIAAVNIAVSGGLGFVAAHHLLGQSLIPSLFIAVALTTTSIGVSTNVWNRYRSLHCREGEMMIDVAEIDDLTGVILLALLTALLPYLQKGIGPALVWPTLWTFGLLLLKMAGLMLAGLLFARYLERPMMRLLRAVQLRSNTMLLVLGIALLVAGLTGVLGFPVAIGGFFAGLLFSRDRHSVAIGDAFDSLYHLFVPFFFVGVGFALDLWRLGPTLGPALVLLVAAVIGKGIGSFVPAQLTMPPQSAGLLAVSLLPRSEITLVIMQRGLDLGAVSRDAFTSVVLVVVTTMVGVPLLLLLLPDSTPPPSSAP